MNITSKRDHCHTRTVHITHANEHLSCIKTVALYVVAPNFIGFFASITHGGAVVQHNYRVDLLTNFYFLCHAQLNTGQANDNCHQ